MKSTFKAMVLVFVSILTLTVNSVTLNAQSVTSTTNCADYQLSTDKDNIYSNKDELKVTLHYDSKDPLCTAEQLAEEQVTIDLSNLVKSGSEISSSYDTDVFNINISDTGVVTISYKEWDTIHNTLESFSGDAVFTVTVDVDESGDKVITSNVGDDLTVNVQLDDDVYDNTNKWANVNYAQVGDVINYKIRINTDRNEVTNFVGVDTPPAGLDYVDGSFTVKDYSTGEVINPNIFTLEQGEDGSLTFKNTEPFSKTYIISYDMIVTGQYETYKNNLSATYDGTEENDVYTVKYDVQGGGDISFTNGQIDILKTDTEGTVLPGAEFDIINADGNTVEHVTSDDSGHAVTDKLALGDYQVVETVAPDGYELDETPHAVSITEADQVAQITVVDEKEDSNCNHDCNCNHDHDHDCNGNHGNGHDCNGNHGNGHDCNGNHGNGHDCNGHHGNGHDCDDK